jgi:5-formyltetrahydrofolate cyclo-ligase
VKIELRQQLRARLKNIPEQKRRDDSLQACALLREQPLWRQIRSVLFYSPLPGELDVLPLLRQAIAEGKAVALPRFVPQRQCYEAAIVRDFSKDCIPGQFGIFEPARNSPSIALNQLDLLLAPGLGFDAVGFRLGRGRGFYDRMLAGNVPGIKCGVAFEEQIIGRIPREPQDVRLDCVLTPTRWLQTAGLSTPE